MTPEEESELLAAEFIYKIQENDSNWPFSVASTMAFSIGLEHFLFIFVIKKRDSALWLVGLQKHIQ